LKLIRKDKLLKLKRKNQGNLKLAKAIDKLIADIESANWKNKMELIESRPDADRVHSEDFFFFDINVHRTLTLVVFTEQYAEVLWVGNHDEYDSIFQGNKKTIKVWLRNHGKLSKLDRLDIDNILKVDELNSELEFEQATAILDKLRWMVKEDNSLEPIRQRLLELIEKYEAKNWGNESEITDEQIRESDLAEKIVNAENTFIQKRKERIKEKLKENGMNQKDLGLILGHRPNYMSELMNGVRPFSRDDIVVIHRLFDIDFKDLIPPFLKKDVTNHIRTTVGELRNKKVRLRIKDLEAV